MRTISGEVEVILWLILPLIDLNWLILPLLIHH